MTNTAYALRDIDTVVPVTILRAHSWGWGQAGGYQVTAGERSWFAQFVWDTEAEAAQAAGDQAHDLDL